MRVRTSRPIRLTGWTLTLSLMLTEAAYGQALRGPVVPPARIEDWFHSRLIWAAVVAAAGGALVGLFHLSKLKYYSVEHSVNSRCRRWFGVWALIAAGAAGLSLLYDALKYPFVPGTLDISNAFNQVWLNWRTFVVVLASLAAFSLLASFATRFAPGSRCPYALWPFHPEGK